MQSASPNRSHRGEVVVQDVLGATRDELTRVGYRALRIEDVATRANVNRTTVYRRWPSKVDLVRATLQWMFADIPDVEPDTGSFRGDLLLVAREMISFMLSANGQVMIRMIMAEGAEPELRAIVEDLRQEKDALLRQMFARAKARGEICENLRQELFMSLLVGGVHHRLFALCVDPGVIDIEEHVDLLLAGALIRR